MRVMGSPAAGCERADGESEYRVGGVQGLVLWFFGISWMIPSKMPMPSVLSE